MTGSAIYEGWIAHRRLGPVPHSFRYRVFLPLFDLDELPELLDPIPLWSARRAAPARFRESDYLSGGDAPLSERARDVVEAALGRRPGGPVRILANPRYLGVGFNPLALYFLHSEGDGSLDAVIAEVTNTPWRERVAYVLDGRSSSAPEGNFDKRMHVSPFQPMDQRYAISVSEPGDRLTVEIRNEEQGQAVFVAAMTLRRTPLTRARLLRALFSYPPMTIATVARIYANALKLARRGAAYHPHPEAIAEPDPIRAPACAARRRDHDGTVTSRASARGRRHR
jgi:DUF1365 family protein